MSYLLMAFRCHDGVVLKSLRITLPGRAPGAPLRVEQADVEALRSAAAVSRVGLWPPPRP
jgi:hypothetical protein